MLSPQLQSALGQIFSQKLKVAINSLHFQRVGGGSINEAYKVTVNHQLHFFIKINTAEAFPELFEKEKKGLSYLAAQQIIKVPEVIHCSVIHNQQVLILDWISAGQQTDEFWKKFGQQLAALHYVSGKEFGWTEDNYMGSIVQVNTQHTNWVDFFIRERLQPLVSQSRNRNLLHTKHLQLFENLYTLLASLFEPEPPALLHGDLWSGNFMCNQSAEPVLIDPAIYFGHRSVDLGMTTLFGCFQPLFYEAYHYFYPFPYNYREQWNICNLYPLLIHLLLFGSGYLRQIDEILITYL